MVIGSGRLMQVDSEKLRIDKWLWAARFYKTRSLASEAISKGQVLINGQKPKPSRGVSIGDKLTITRGPQQFDVTVLALNDKRRPAVEAQQIYVESEQSIARRELVSARLRDEWSVTRGLRGEGRPSKRQRRQIIRFQNTQSDHSAAQPQPGSESDCTDGLPSDDQLD